MSSFLSGVRNLVEFLDSHSGVIVSLATAVIATFTLATLWVTERLAKLMRASLKLAHSEFISTNRPKIITRGFEANSPPGSNQKALLMFTYVNVGNTPATIISIGAIITGDSEPGLNLQERSLDPPIRLASGQQRRWLLDIDEPPMGRGVIFCLGCITYKDALGHTRVTGFCRQFDPASGRWIRQTNSDYEYQD